MRGTNHAGTDHAGRSVIVGAALSLVAVARAAHAAADAVSYQADVRAVFVERCLGCHNADARKGDLDLSTHAAVMAGGSGGAVVVPGDPDASRLLLVMTHAAEPRMPPRGDRTPDAQLDLVRKWIADGCVDAKGGRPAPIRKAVSFAAAPSAEATPLDTLALPLVTPAPTVRAPAVASLAMHPVSPVLAAAAHGQVLVYRMPMLEPIGALPTDGLRATKVGFTRDGRHVFAAVGMGAASGGVRVWDASTGELVASVGAEVDEVLACDVDLPRDRVAIGGPSRIVKVHRAGDGGLVHRIVKHTDWVTAVAYSPDGVLLATADRGGGLHVWEGESGAPYMSLGGHPAAIRGLDWSPDGNVVVTCGEDGRVRMWELSSGGMAKEWSAHAPGALHVGIGRDGSIVTAGRDRLVKVWTASGSMVRQVGPLDDVVLAAARSADDAVLVGAGLGGTVSAWRTDGTPLGALQANPPMLPERMARAEQASGAGAADARSLLGFLRCGQARERRDALARALDAAMQRHDADRSAMEAARDRADRATALVAILDPGRVELARRLSASHESIRLASAAVRDAEREVARRERVASFAGATLAQQRERAWTLMMASSEAMLDDDLAERAFTAWESVRRLARADDAARASLQRARDRQLAAVAALDLEASLQASIEWMLPTSACAAVFADDALELSIERESLSRTALEDARRMHEEASAEYARLVEEANRTVTASAGG
ncbi:MAG: c-type cytochrome domain-containing protein [Phycisphaerales bacterium]